MSRKRNPWISIADLLSSVVLVLLLMFVLAAVAPKYTQEAQRRSMMEQIDEALLDYKERGLLIVNQEKGVLEFTAVTFASGSAALGQDTAPLINDIAVRLRQYMREHPRMAVLIEGHTDPASVTGIVNVGGYYENNIQLSALRAANVREALLRQMGKEYANRIGVAGYGETRLKNTQNPMSAENRRIEIRFLWSGQER